MMSMFCGILVSIPFEDERHKLPHILVQYTEYEASISFSDGRVLAGDIPPKQIKMAQAWIQIHHDELLANGQLAVAGEQPFRIAPLQ